MNTPTTPSLCPYKGLQPYTEDDREYFFGRESDQEVVASNLYVAPLTILYGTSGVGKSSVLQAGVVPQLKRRRRVTVVFFNSWQDESFELALKTEVLRAVCESVKQSRETVLREVASALDRKETAGVESLTFDALLRGCARAFSHSILLIFDQFEEYFLYHAPTIEAEGFDAALARAVNQYETGVNFMLSMREEELSKLDRFRTRIPNLLGNLLRLEHLDYEAAVNAIREPLRVYNEKNPTQAMQIEDALVAEIIEQVRPEHFAERTAGLLPTAAAPAHGNVDARPDVRIETPFLQLVLTRLWEAERADGSHTLSLAKFEALGGARDIARRHLEGVMDKLDESQRATAAAVLRFLVTPTGSKIAQQPAALAGWADLTERDVLPVLTMLSAGQDTRILRKVSVPMQSDRYELFHDVLGPAILSWRAGYMEIQGRAKAEREAAEQRRRADEHVRIARRLRALVAGMVLMFLLATGAAAYAFTQSREALRQNRLATLKATEAEEQKAEAERQKQRADERAQEADNQRDLAKEQAAIAEANEAKAKKANQAEAEQRKVAQTQALLAANRAREAEAAKKEALASQKTAEEQTKIAKRNEDDAFRAKQRAIAEQARAEAQRIQAEHNARNSRLASANLLAVQANELNRTHPQRSLLLAVESIKALEKGDPRVPAAEETLRRVLSQTGGRVLSRHEATVDDVAISPDNRWMVSLSVKDKTAQVWDLTATGAAAEPHVLKDVGGPIAISPDGRWLVNGSLAANLGWSATKEFVPHSPTASIRDLRVPNAPPKPLRGAESSVSLINFSPDGRWLLTDDTGEETRLWDLNAADPTANPKIFPAGIKTHDRADLVTRISPDGHWLITGKKIEEGGDKYALNIWDLTAANPAAKAVVLGGHTVPITHAVFSPDANWLVTSSDECTPRTGAKDSNALLWNLKTLDANAAPPAPTVLAGHKGAISEVIISPDSSLLVTSGSQQGLGICDTEELMLVWDLKNPSAAPRALAGDDMPVAVDSKNRWLITFVSGNEQSSRGDATGGHRARIWNLEEKDAKPISLGRANRPFSVDLITVSPDGRWLFITDEVNVARLWDLRAFDRNDLRTLRGHEGIIASATFGKDGRSVVTGSEDRSARLWRLGEVPSSGGVSPLVFADRGDEFFLSPDHHLVMTKGTNHSAHVWDLKATDPTDKPITLQGHTSNIFDAAFSRDHRWLATGSHDQTARLWDLTAANPSASAKVLRGHTSVVDRVAISPDNRWLVTGSFDGTARVWDLKSPDPTANPKVLADNEKDARGGSKAVFGVYISPDSRWVLIDKKAQATSRLWDLSAIDPNSSAQVLGPLENARFSPDGHWLVVILRGQPARLWNLATGNKTEGPRLLQGVEKNSRVAFSPDKRWLFTETSSHGARLWDLNAPDPTAAFTDLPDAHSEAIADVIFSPDNQWLATASYDSTARVWNLKKMGDKPFVLRGHTIAVSKVDISADSRWLVTGSFYDKTARLWDLSDPHISETPILLPITGSIHSAVFSRDGSDSRWLMLSDYDAKSVSLWSMRLQELVEAACRTAGRNLNAEEWKKYFSGQEPRETCPELSVRR